MKAIVSTLSILLASVLWADASNDLVVARTALRDGLWELARSHAEAVTGPATNTARQVILESFALEGRWADVKAKLAAWGEPVGSFFDYYRAAAFGRLAEAAKLLESAGSTEAKMLQAEVCLAAGNRAKAEDCWRAVVAASNSSERAFCVAAANLGDVAALRTAVARTKSSPLRRTASLRLGTVLLASTNTCAEGESLVRSLVRDAPDAPGAREAFLAIADAALSARRWSEALAAYRDAAEIWPDTAKDVRVLDGRGRALLGLDRAEEALIAFKLAAESAKDDLARATALAKAGDALARLGRAEESLETYRKAQAACPDSPFAALIRARLAVRERETKGRELYRGFRFAEAQKVFAEVAAADPARRARMDYFTILCLYGQGQDGAAQRRAVELAADCDDAAVRADATLWLAKFLYNRGEWKSAAPLFADFAALRPDDPEAPEARLWSARALLAAGDFKGAVQSVTRLLETKPSESLRTSALLVQGEALVELARFDEAVLVLERVAPSGSDAERRRAQILKADALYAMGADNPSRYRVALEAYRAIRFGSDLTPSLRLVLAFKSARTLEKLKRVDEADDQYYTQVVLAYLNGRRNGETFDDEARAAFSRAAFRLADDYASRGREMQTRAILELVAGSDVPAAAEAAKRLDRLSAKGRFQ